MASNANANAAQELNDLKATSDALHRVQAIIEFDLQGNILAANQHFLNTLGYKPDEVIGRPHRFF